MYECMSIIFEFVSLEAGSTVDFCAPSYGGIFFIDKIKFIERKQVTMTASCEIISYATADADDLTYLDRSKLFCQSEHTRN